MLPLQEKMLLAAADSLNKNGTLLYCTCSISKSEGENQIKRFLQNNNNFELQKICIDKLNVYSEKKLPEFIIDNTVLRTLPYYMEDIGGMDSFFAACLKKK